MFKSGESTVRRRWILSVVLALGGMLSASCSSDKASAGGSCENACTPTTLASGQTTPNAIAVDATSVYWTSQEGGTVMKVPLAGGTPITLASGQPGPGAIAVDATSVYWTDGYGVSVMKVSLAGGTRTTLASGLSNATTIAVDAKNVYWTNYVPPDVDSGTMIRVPLGGGTPTTLASWGQFNATAIAVDAISVYWTAGDRVMRLDKQGCQS